MPNVEEEIKNYYTKSIYRLSTHPDRLASISIIFIRNKENYTQLSLRRVYEESVHSIANHTTYNNTT